jgi:hypothetical protein
MLAPTDDVGSYGLLWHGILASHQEKHMSYVARESQRFRDPPIVHIYAYFCTVSL